MAAAYWGRDELDAAILLAAEDLQAHMTQLQVEETRVPEYHTALAQAHAAGIFGSRSDSAIAVSASLPRATTFGAPIPHIRTLDPESNLRLVSALAPTHLALTSGRSVIRPPGDANDLHAERVEEAFLPAAHACSWVCAGGCLDLSAQVRAFRAAGYSDFRAQVYVVGVELQRQQRRPGGEFSEWQGVPPLAGPPAPPLLDRDSGLVLNKQELRQAYECVRQQQPKLRRPSPPEVLAGSAWQPPTTDGRAQDSPEQERMHVWALDGTAQPGQTYRYRLRCEPLEPLRRSPRSARRP